MTEASSQSYLAIQKNKRKLENKNAVGSET